MIQVEYPNFAHQIKSLDQKEQIFDPFRKIWIRLTPEEWVRQNFLQVLVQKQGVPASLIAIEKEIKWGETKKRFDILVYKDTKPWLIVECKEMNVPLSELVLQQVLQYNSKLETQYIVITNGNDTFGFNIKNQTPIVMETLPNFITD
ncbi:MAG: hypothetical protein RL372_828 [Bacteroidota bacterium]